MCFDKLLINYAVQFSQEGLYGWKTIVAGDNNGKKNTGNGRSKRRNTTEQK